MRIGELLRERGWVDPSALDRAIAEQRHTGKRLVSLLVSRGLIAVDEGARGLGQQHNCAAALQRHLDNRDRRLASIIPPELARSCCALPIGRGRSGEIIICVRDPRPQIATALSQATKQMVLVAVTPALVIEKLVEQTYGAPSDEEFDVDLSTGPIDVPPDVASRPPTMSSIGLHVELDPIDSLNLASMQLVELDDIGVAKDHHQHQQTSQSGLFVLPAKTAEGSSSRTPAPPPPPAIELAAGTVLPGAKIEIVSLEDTLKKLERATTRDGATDIAMVFVRGRWVSSLFFTIKEGMGLGHRGHGGLVTDEAVEAITVPLATTSIVRSANDARKIVTSVPPKSGAIQERIAKIMGHPKSPAAAPVLVGQRVAGVLVVGDSREAADATEDMTLDLDDLSVALGLAYARILREAKKP